MQKKKRAKLDITQKKKQEGKMAKKIRIET